MAPVFIICGFVIAMWGKQLFAGICFLVGSFISATLLLLLYYSQFVTADTKIGWIWTVSVVCILLGLVGGYILYKLQRIAGAILAAWGGFMISMLIASTFLKNSSIAFWLFNFIIALVCAVVSYFAYYHTVIISTGFIGSYLLVRGVSLFTGGFPNELEYIKKA
jgi:hypothetical protein